MQESAIESELIVEELLVEGGELSVGVEIIIDEFHLLSEGSQHWLRLVIVVYSLLDYDRFLLIGLCYAVDVGLNNNSSSKLQAISLLPFCLTLLTAFPLLILT